jgi:hypothetical protein
MQNPEPSTDAVIPAAIPEAELSQVPAKSKTLEFLYSIKGRATVGGLHNRQPNADPTRYSRQLHTVTGQYPALYSADFQFERDEIANRQKVIDQIQVEWKNGAIVQMMWHACNPAKSRPCEWDANGVLSKMSDAEWKELLTDGSPINRNWKAMMDEVAVYLQQLEDAGVEVLFRPLHEMNQKMFWWGGRPGINGTAGLFRLTQDYFKNTKGLTNLIWVWNLQDFNTLASDLNAYDPGREYYDILSLDMYWSDGQGYTPAKYNAVKQKAGDKLIAIGECEDLPSPEILSNQPDWVFFMGWSELTFSGNSNEKVKTVYNSSRVLTLNELPGWNDFRRYIQAEDYNGMNGVIQGPAGDQDGGISVGSIDTGDWLVYDNVNIPKAGVYTIAYRVASPSGGILQLEQAGGNGPIYGQMNIPSTGGWNQWTTVYHQVSLPAGPQSFGIKAIAGGWNFNWLSISL